MSKTTISNDDLQKLSYNIAEELCWYVRASEGRFDGVFERRIRPVINRLGLSYEKYERILKEKDISITSIKDRIVDDIVNGQSETYALEKTEEIK